MVRHRFYRCGICLQGRGLFKTLAPVRVALRGEAQQSIALLGVDLDRYDRIVDLRGKVVSGVARLAPGEGNVGRDLAADLGLLLAVALISAFTHFVKGSDGLPLFNITLPRRVALNVAVVASVCGVLAAIAPARRAAAMDPAQAIRL